MRSAKSAPYILFSLMVVAPAVSNANFDAVQTDRYTSVSLEPLPEQVSPILAVVNIQFSDNVKTVGDAIFELLAGSGYRWDISSAENHRLMDLPLPMVSRELGPIRLRDALSALAGQSWELKVDELTRTIHFNVRGH
jgi:conjugative transfer region protein (TIGR03748 family)